MTEPHDSAPPRSHVARRERIRARQSGWGSGDVVRAAALVIAMYVLVRLIWVANPLFLTAFIGILFGLAVSSGVDRLARLGVRRGVGAALVVVAFFTLLVSFGAWLAPTIHAQGLELRRRLPDAIDRFDDWVSARREGFVGLVFSGFMPASSDTMPGTQLPTSAPGAQPRLPTEPAAASPPPDSITVAATLRHRLGAQFTRLTRYLFPFLSSTVEVVTGFLIIIFLSIYIAADPDLYRRGIMHLFPHERRARGGEVLTAIAAVLRKWFVTQLIAMFIMGLVTTFVLLAMHVKAALLLGILSGLLEFIPTVGPILSSLPAIAMGFLDSPEKAVWVAVAYLIVHFLESHLLIPLLMKGGVQIAPALTILSQALMALLFGFLGLMCAVPLLAASTVAVKMLYVEDVVGDRQIGPGEEPAKGVET
ncbi:MAG TPA: AI-2E family transporter [Gemmatimonadaceae bacterium]|jgi:predicted PurR-regulated permease PerM|nr:AI-2E family transporter [Gemmatimonadaceae bacterium]